MPARKVILLMEYTWLIQTIRLHAFLVYCNMSVDGSGWVLLQRRFGGSVKFDRVWTECEHGFGNIIGEYWVGLIKVHCLTASALQELRIDLKDFQGNKRCAHYSTFILWIMLLHSIAWLCLVILTQLTIWDTHLVLDFLQKTTNMIHQANCSVQ